MQTVEASRYKESIATNEKEKYEIITDDLKLWTCQEKKLNIIDLEQKG